MQVQVRADNSVVSSRRAARAEQMRRRRARTAGQAGAGGGAGAPRACGGLTIGA